MNKIIEAFIVGLVVGLLSGFSFALMIVKDKGF